MKGITSHVMVIIFSLIIMVVLLVVGIGFVQNYTNIPFEKLWELTPQTVIATEPGYVNKGGLGSVSDIKLQHILSGTYDLSEIACYIGRDIYNDYSKNADSGTRNDYYDKSFPSNSVYLVGKGSFSYQSTASSNNADEVTLNTFDSACHLCREPPSPPLNSGGIGIIHLDEVCINLQLRDRKVTIANLDFCNQQFITPSNENGKFGNKDCGTAFNTPAWQLHCDNVGAFPGEFCSNGGAADQDKIRWIAGTDNDNFANNATDNGFDQFNDEKLTSGRDYVYSVFWEPALKKYNVVFSVIPTGKLLNVGWDYIWKVQKSPNENFRRNAIGRDYTDARIVENYTFTPTAPISIGNELIPSIGTTVNLFIPCSTYAECFPGWTSLGSEDCRVYVGANPYDSVVRPLPIKLLINATDNGIDGIPNTADDLKITDPNSFLLTGRTYRVVIKEWFNENYQTRNWMTFACINKYDRSITIIQEGFT